VTENDENKTIRWCILALILIGLVRLLSLGAYPLMDNTESRYAEIGRVMAASGDWVTPTLTDGRPFWAKPPLSIWATAASLKAFGVNEFAARLPYFLLAGGLLALTYSLARSLAGRTRAWLATAILGTCALFFISAGAVMTDMAMVLGTTLAFVGFWRCQSEERNTRWGVAAFFGAGLALLGKGPVGLVLLGLPILAWCAVRRDLRPLARLPWLAGVPVLLLTAVPWYAAAERKTPGFLNYFIVGEHVKRFLDPGWKGDLYGTAHVQPKGMIWAYGLLAAFPWSFVALGNAPRLPGALSRPEVSYLVCWALTPLVFFTLSGNILYTYVLPGLPAFAVLLTLGLRRPDRAAMGAIGSAIVTGLLIIGGLSALNTGKLRTPSDRALIRVAQPTEAAPLVYLQEPPNSAWFYAQGKGVRQAEQPDPETRWLVSEKDLPPALAETFAPQGRFGKKTLYRRKR
jgi:4-amino-4-deoxy-L-arabinose transferase-like glycosyltransferase